MVAGVRPETSSAWISAVSVSGSVPSTCASAWLPSLNVTRRVPPSPASSTTWLLVRIWPSELRMMPEPEPAPWAPLTSIFTTDGSTFAATASTLPSAAGVLGVLTTLEVVGVAALPEPEDELVVVPGGVGRRATDTGGTAHEEGSRHQRAREGDAPRLRRCHWAAWWAAEWRGALGDGCPAYGRHVGGVSGGGGSGAVSPVSVTTTTCRPDL